MTTLNSFQQMVWGRTGCCSCILDSVSAHWKGNFPFILCIFVAALSSLTGISVIYNQELLSIGNSSSVVQRNTEIPAKPDNLLPLLLCKCQLVRELVGLQILDAMHLWPLGRIANDWRSLRVQLQTYAEVAVCRRFGCCRTVVNLLKIHKG